MLTEILVLTALLTAPITISLLVLWSAHRGHLRETGAKPQN
jgi:hypothetical protein